MSKKTNNKEIKTKPKVSPKNIDKKGNIHLRLTKENQ